MDKKIASLLSLCQRAGKILTGEDSCLKAIRSGEAQLILLSSDASDNTKKRFNDKTKFYNIKLLTVGTRQEMSKAIGKDNRVTLAVCDERFAAQIIMQHERTQTHEIASMKN